MHAPQKLSQFDLRMTVVSRLMAMCRNLVQETGRMGNLVMQILQRLRSECECIPQILARRFGSSRDFVRR